MKVELTEFRAAPGSCQEAGTVMELPDGEAQDLIRRNRAKPFAETAAVEPPANAADERPRENATKKPREKRG